MTNAQKQIVLKLDELFAPFDADVLENSIKWADGRVAALKEYQASEMYQNDRKNQHVLYGKLFRIAGGKTWYNVFSGRNKAMIDEFMIKNCAATVANRNASIASKLVKAEVNEVIDENYARTTDGFNGMYSVNTNNGRKSIKISTIIAGGYNIQCRHLRVLVKVK